MIGAILLLIHTLSIDEVIIIDRYQNLELIGDAKQRFSRSLQKILVKSFGKNGLLGIDIIILIGVSLGLYSNISEYRRYKYKCRLYQEGIIKNFFDIYDDEPSFGILRGIKNIFLRKKNKFPSKRQVKKQEKEIDEYFKEK